MADSPVRSEKHDDVAVLTIDSPPVNSLSQPVVRGIVNRLAEANADAAVRAIVLRGANDNFIAGADISELQSVAEGRQTTKIGGALTSVLAEIEANAKPIVMAIDGYALGGGLEVAMAGHYRVGTPRSRVGLPELTLGIIPGAGGTQRLPRLVGVQKAIEMMLQSSELRGTEALALGVFDELVEPEALLPAAVAAARLLAEGKLERVVASQRNDKIGTAAEAEQVMAMARAMAGDKLRNIVHPEMCMDAVLVGVRDGYAAGLAREAANFERCINSQQAAGMIHVFFATRAAPKVPGVTDQGFTRRTIQKVAVLGGGAMGSGIATVLLQAGVEVTLKEIDEEQAAAGRGRIESNLQSRLKKGRITQQQYDETLARLTTRIDYAGLDAVDMVIEAVIENIELKQQVFADLERHCAPDCILASNTSTIDLEVIGARTGAAARILGTHFFSPAHVMPLVEIVRSRRTSPETLNSVIQLAKRIRKTPVTVGNCVGFLVNRIFFPYGQTAGLLVDCGVDVYRIDKALYDFGLPMGPFRMSDLAGVDVAQFAGGILADAYRDRSYVSTLNSRLFEAQRFGQKTGRGYYLYNGKNALPDPEIVHFERQARADAGNPAQLEVSDAEIVERVLFGVINEACRCLDEGIAIRPSDIDIACVMGMGFPAYRGGIMKYADTLGARYVHDKLAQWAEVHGPVYAPCAYLAAKATSDESLVR